MEIEPEEAARRPFQTLWTRSVSLVPPERPAERSFSAFANSADTNRLS